MNKQAAPTTCSLSPCVQLLMLGHLLAFACGDIGSTHASSSAETQHAATEPAGPGRAPAARTSPGVHDSAQEVVTPKAPTPARETSATHKDTEDFTLFWRAFRHAALQRDLDALAQLSHLPISARGSLDDDPVRTTPRSKLQPLLLTLLNQPVATRGEPQTHEQYLQAHDVPPADAVENSGKYARVGDIVFELRPNGWRWTEAYSD